MTEPDGSAARRRPRLDPDLLARAAALAAGGRRLLGLAGPPGAGKSTLAAALVGALGDRAVLVPMDGFHLAQAELERLGRADRKGAPDTFDADGFVALLARLRAQGPGDPVVYAPRFDRHLEEPIAGAIGVPATVPLVVVEGNYLLHDEGAWAGVAPLLDDAWYLDLPDDGARRAPGRPARRARPHPSGGPGLGAAFGRGERAAGRARPRPGRAGRPDELTSMSRRHRCQDGRRELPRTRRRGPRSHPLQRRRARRARRLRLRARGRQGRRRTATGSCRPRRPRWTAARRGWAPPSSTRRSRCGPPGVTAPVLSWLYAPGARFADALRLGVDLSVGAPWMLAEILDTAREIGHAGAAAREGRHRPGPQRR